jgi:hypothetical protein
LEKLKQPERSSATTGLQPKKYKHTRCLNKSNYAKTYRKHQKPFCFKDNFITEVGRFPDPSFLLARPSIFPETEIQENNKKNFQGKEKS